MARQNVKRILLPSQLCPCRSGWMVASCCFDKADGKLRKRIKSIRPPPPATGYGHPSCYLRGTRDCSEDISREHYVSAAVLEQLGSPINIIGAPWLKPGQPASYGIGNLVAKILCRRHNQALSPLDQEAAIFFGALARSLSELERASSSRKYGLHLASGSALELWALKVACGFYFSAIAAKDTVSLSKTHSIDLAKIGRAFFEDDWEGARWLLAILRASSLER
jgi:hypothetical protein